MSRNMNIKLDDATYKVFEAAAQVVSKKRIKVPIVHLAEVIINTEFSEMDSKKIAKRFIKSLMPHEKEEENSNLKNEP